MIRILHILGAALAVCSCEFSLPQTTLMELPAYSVTDNIIEHEGYVLCYNTGTLTPDWVAYEMTAEECAGHLDRDSFNFRMDPSWSGTQAMREDYANSGWTKGHMACAGDFHWDEDAMKETFYLTNICPQDKTLNAGDWNYLEKKVRSWAKKHGSVWVVSGPIAGSGKYGRIGERGVEIPDAFFKAVMYEKNGKYHAIAFIMGNDANRYYLKDCAVSINELESITGLDFYPMLDDSVEEQVEARVNFSDWGIR